MFPLNRARATLFVCLCAFISTAYPQNSVTRVDPMNMYERVLAVIPITGQGTSTDPKRPLLTPITAQIVPGSHSGILAFHYIESDDGHFALVEIVAKDRASLQPFLGEPTAKCFLKGRDKLEDAVKEFQKHSSSFDINKFMVRVP